MKSARKGTKVYLTSNIRNRRRTRRFENHVSRRNWYKKYRGPYKVSAVLKQRHPRNGKKPKECWNSYLSPIQWNLSVTSMNMSHQLSPTRTKKRSCPMTSTMTPTIVARPNVNKLDRTLYRYCSLSESKTKRPSHRKILKLTTLKPSRSTKKQILLTTSICCITFAS